MAVHLGGPGRVVLAEDYVQPEGLSETAWARGVVIPADPPGGISFVPGRSTRVGFNFRVVANLLDDAGYKPNRRAQKAQKEAHARLRHWIMPLATSTEVMMVRAARMVGMWEQQLTYDGSTTRTASIVSSYVLDVAEAPPA